MHLGLAEEFPRAVLAGGDVFIDGEPAHRLVNRAERLRQAIVGTTIRGRVARAVTIRDEMIERRATEERQVAGNHQPGRLGHLGLCRGDAGDRPLVTQAIDDFRKAVAHFVFDLVLAHGNEYAPADFAHEVERPIELRAIVIEEGGLVALHACTRATRQDQAVERRAHFFPASPACGTGLTLFAPSSACGRGPG